MINRAASAISEMPGAPIKAAATGGLGGFHVLDGISNHKASIRGHILISEGPPDHSRRGLAALALFSHGMRTKVNFGDRDSRFAQYAEQLAVAVDKIAVSEIAEADALLIGDHIQSRKPAACNIRNASITPGRSSTCEGSKQASRTSVPSRSSRTSPCASAEAFSGTA